ncbi:uncharacterized protein LOC120281267 [Dioscorea cayenensis subsp. rotundata]|uniref:Uncharacterized protein LOC120281267 n=1 Tax=Dioscorea cayennensis subsp. rotundata TaxID=55577 RepID=A0AB40CVE2_DIOCR|nr:uncharacterized protein LOC120281267 [Dioscorea cayenensis subsp. rotundata]
MAKVKLFLMLFLATLVSTVATMEEDEKECADQLQNLASCIPYVSGIAPKADTTLSPDSPDAKIFKEAGDDASTNTNTTSSGTTSSSSGSKVAPADNEARLESSVGLVCLVISTICMMFM